MTMHPDVEREVENVMALLPRGTWRRFAMERVRALMEAVQNDCKARIEAIPEHEDEGLVSREDVLATFAVQEEPPRDIRETLIDPDTL